MPQLVRFDFAIKKLLRNKANFDILEGFLSELLNTDIKIAAILESESNKDPKEDKSNRVDLLVDAGQERVIIEVQCSNEWDFISRIYYGVCKATTEYMKQGESYQNVPKIISVSIVYFNLGEGQDYVYEGKTHFVGRHIDEELQLGPNEIKIYGQGKSPSDIFARYYIIRVNVFNNRIKDKLDEWIYFLKNSEIKSGFHARGIHSAAEKLAVLRLNEQQRREYEAYQDQLHYEASMALSKKIDMENMREEIDARIIERAKPKIKEELKEEVRSEIIEEERPKIIEQERPKIIEQERPKIIEEKMYETAKKMLALGMSLEEIHQVTDLSFDSLHELQESITLS